MTHPDATTSPRPPADGPRVPNDDEIAAVLRSAGLSRTRPRAEVLRHLSAHPHSSALDVAGAVRGALGTVSHQAVYNILHAFVDRGVARRIEPVGHPALYELGVDNHHHLVCRTCGDVQDVACVVGKAPCLSPDDGHGFVVDEAEVTFWGSCPSCSAAATAATSAHTATT